MAEWTPEANTAMKAAIREVVPELEGDKVRKLMRAVLNTLAAEKLIAAVPPQEEAPEPAKEKAGHSTQVRR